MGIGSNSRSCQKAREKLGRKSLLSLFQYQYGLASPEDCQKTRDCYFYTFMLRWANIILRCLTALTMHPSNHPEIVEGSNNSGWSFDKLRMINLHGEPVEPFFDPRMSLGCSKDMQTRNSGNSLLMNCSVGTQQARRLLSERTIYPLMNSGQTCRITLS